MFICPIFCYYVQAYVDLIITLAQWHFVPHFQPIKQCINKWTSLITWRLSTNQKPFNNMNILFYSFPRRMLQIHIISQYIAYNKSTQQIITFNEFTSKQFIAFSCKIFRIFHLDFPKHFLKNANTADKSATGLPNEKR